MNFDDFEKISQIDVDKLIDHIRNLPELLVSGWSYSKLQEPIHIDNISRVVLAGFSKIENSIAIFKLLINKHCSVPVITINENHFPIWCKNPDTLVIFLIDQNNFGEILNFLGSSYANNCSIITLTNNQSIEKQLMNYSVNNWIFDNHTFSRLTVAFDVMVLCGLFHKLNLIPDMSNEFQSTIAGLRKTMSKIDFNVTSALNPAKRLAGQMVGRWIKIVGGDCMVPIARRWSDQINESSKTMSYAEGIHQLINHSINGSFFPDNIVQQSMVIFLKSNLNDESIENLVDLAKKELMCNGIGTDVYTTLGETFFSQVWNTILFGDYLAYYLAIAYECDPSKTLTII
ncbi:MAG: SIS domain-containing protein [Anaerolineaceae bacterium]|nr:SIS domain-containing protein [Anaerolineaceae bacterium]